MSDIATTVTLRALAGRPLDDHAVRDMIKATASAIAERQGVDLVIMQTEPDSITVTLRTGRIEAVGFAAELRRLTTNWYAHKYGIDNLWGEVDHEDDDGEQWKTT